MTVDEKLLRKYIQESLLIEKVSIGLGGAYSSIKDTAAELLGRRNFRSTGPEKWFEDFMDRQLDKIDKSVSELIGSKLDKLLPEDLQAEIERARKEDNTSSSSLSDNLAKAVHAWIDLEEETSKKSFSSSTKKEILNFATEVYAKSIKQDKNEHRALLKVKRELDAKYGLKKRSKSEE